MKFNYVRDIVSFNRQQYAAGIVTVAAAQLAKRSRNPLIKGAAHTSSALASYLMCSSLAASWYVYDHSDLYEWKWLINSLESQPDTWASIHEGYNEAGIKMAAVIGDPDYSFDVSSGLAKLTPSIKRARDAYTSSGAKASPESLPLKDGKVDAAFALFSAHEIRDRTKRIALLKEMGRIVKEDGQVVIVEHTRNVANTLVFGHGALHFFSRQQWLEDASKANLRLTKELTKTPFVKAWILEQA